MLGTEALSNLSIPVLHSSILLSHHAITYGLAQPD